MWVVVIRIVKTSDPVGVRHMVVDIIIIHNVFTIVLVWYENCVLSFTLGIAKVISLNFVVPVRFFLGIYVIIKCLGTFFIFA
jgi:hypothetical protein